MKRSNTRPGLFHWLGGAVIGVTVLSSLAFMPGCSRPCQATAQCGGDDVCVAATCQAVSCDTPVFAVDPGTGACVALSGCFLTDAQRSWKTCAADPCQGQAESSCLDDRRCQPVYHSPDVPAGTFQTDGPGCAGEAAPRVDPGPGIPGGVPTAGVNNGAAPKHPTSNTQLCSGGARRAYAGCRAVPQIADRPGCETLDATACQARRDCTTDAQKVDGAPSGNVPTPVPLPFPTKTGVDVPAQGQCFARHPRSTGCDLSNRLGCLTNPECQPIGESCFCPPGASCACSGGGFLGCEANDHLRRCTGAADCRSGERCDIDEGCAAPRTFGEGGVSAGGCVGACVPTGCAGFGEAMCHGHAECDGGTYGTRCKPQPYCAGGPIILDGQGGAAEAATDPNQGCGCEDVFEGCGVQAAVGTVRPERSLLVRDPEIVSDPAFGLDAVLTALAPAGGEADFVARWVAQIGQAQGLPSGAQAAPRDGWSWFLSTQLVASQRTPAGLAARFHTTALVNRLDLAGAGDCGEARLTYALSDAYTNGSQRMTIIVELRVPDDGQGCKVVAQRWAELSAIDDVATRRERLKGLYAELLPLSQRGAHLGQVRTNEFINRSGKEPWELREWHLSAAGQLELAPCHQTVDPKAAGSPAFLLWARDNLAGLKAGTAVIPTQYLAAASTENGQRLTVPTTYPQAKEIETAVNALSCAGCHLTETKSPFVHVGERLGRSAGAGYVPAGRAVIDEFLSKELLKRAQNLTTILGAGPKDMAVAPWRGRVAPGSH